MIIYLMESSPGLFGGDVQELECTVGKGGHLLLTSQSSCKLHPSPRYLPGSQRVMFTVEQDGVLEYFPGALVPYRDTSYSGETVVHLDAGAQLLMSEIVTPGRTAHGEHFAYGRLDSKLAVYREGRLVIWDPLRLEPAVFPPALVLGGYSHFASFWFLSGRLGQTQLEGARDCIERRASSIYGGASLVQNAGLILRCLGSSVQELESLRQEVWSLLRPHLLGKEAFVLRK